MVCTPLVFFIALAAIWLIVLLLTDMPNKGMAILQTLIWVILLGLIIYYLCKMGRYGWAWFVVFLPLILMTMFMLFFTMGMGIGLGMESAKAIEIMNYLNIKSKKSNKN
jgi:hypothetical protein